MRVTDYMAGLLVEIVKKEPEFETVLFDDTYEAPNVGCDLISMYRETQNLETRCLITEFMYEAGYTWLRKLVTRDLSPTHSAA